MGFEVTQVLKWCNLIRQRYIHIYGTVYVCEAKLQLKNIEELIYVNIF